MEKINQTTGAADTLEPQAAPTPKKEKTATADSFYCYIGPGITGLIQHGDICRGTRKKALATPWSRPSSSPGTNSRKPG